jgi:predicted Na+-dependent transporter
MPVIGTVVKIAKRTRRDIEMSVSLLLTIACLNTRQCLYITYAAHPNTPIAVNLSKPDQMILG